MRIQKFYLAVLCSMAFFLVVSTCSSVSAQVTVAIGPKVGASFSGFRGEDAGNVNFREGLAGGLFINITPVPFFSIQPELLLQQKGAINKNEDFNITEDVEIGYFSVPVLLKFRVPVFHIFFPHVFAGPQFSYKFKSDYTLKTLDLTATRDIDLRDYDVSGVFGAGFDIQSKHLFFSTDVRYDMGALNLDNKELVDLKNSNITVMMGVGFMF